MTVGNDVGILVDSHTKVAMLHVSPRTKSHPVLSEQALPTTPVVHILRTEVSGAKPEQKPTGDSSRPKISEEERNNKRPGPLTGEVVGLLPATFPGIQSEPVTQPQVFVLRHTPEAQCVLSAKVQEPPYLVKEVGANDGTIDGSGGI